jgi:F-type H+-transporting ATPase subunit c
VNKKRIFVTIATLLMSASAFAQTTAPAPTGVRWNLISAAFLLGIAAAAGAIGQGRGIAAACDGIARNPSAGGAIRTAMIIGLALIESLVIYALIIAYLTMNA